VVPPGDDVPPDEFVFVDDVEGVVLVGVFAFFAALGVLAGVVVLEAGGGDGVA
jgi:hypothetical protein